MYYVKITDASFMADLLTDGQVWQVNLVVAKWVVDHGYGFFSDAVGDPAVPPWDNPVVVPPPVMEGGLVANDSPSKVVVGFSAAVVITDATGITVTGGGTSVASVGAVGDQLSITMSAAIANGETIVFNYNAAAGNLLAAGEGATPVATIVGADITNLVLP